MFRLHHILCVTGLDDDIHENITSGIFQSGTRLKRRPWSCRQWRVISSCCSKQILTDFFFYWIMSGERALTSTLGYIKQPGTRLHAAHARICCFCVKQEEVGHHSVTLTYSWVINRPAFYSSSSYIKMHEPTLQSHSRQQILGNAEEKMKWDGFAVAAFRRGLLTCNSVLFLSDWVNISECARVLVHGPGFREHHKYYSSYSATCFMHHKHVCGRVLEPDTEPLTTPRTSKRK